MLELNIGCDEACFCRLMLEQYTAAVSQDPEMEILILVAEEVLKLAAWGPVGWGAGEMSQWWRSGDETNYFVRFRGSATIAWTHLKRFIMYKEYHQDCHWLNLSPSVLSQRLNTSSASGLCLHEALQRKPQLAALLGQCLVFKPRSWFFWTSTWFTSLSRDWRVGTTTHHHYHWPTDDTVVRVHWPALRILESSTDIYYIL